MTKRTIKWLFILVICLMFENVYATDSIYSINKNTDEKLFFIKESFNKNNENNGFVVGGTYLKEIIEADSKTIEDYQVMIVNYKKDGRIDKIGYDLSVKIRKFPDIHVENQGSFSIIKEFYSDSVRNMHVFHLLSLQRIVLKGVEHGGEVTLTGVWQQDDYFLAFVLRAPGHLNGCEESGTGRDTYQQTF